ncbi:hypothetical protein ONZ43_g5900 [Nemania bipapillata]|uniref:Uncharacterized protein n=1 Tax=Nemania bipapillata TaxID=110536 RepID=A0ACC2I593_9PEZI|nr:hypothetical protein ONZ43_g5900 [Nemania bipapillata]
MASPRNAHHQSKQEQISAQLQETRNELRKEREFHEQCKIALREQKKETEEARQSQKKIGIELNNLKAQQQRRYQVTDNELANLAHQLRYQISNIAHVHFKQGVEITNKSMRDSWQLLRDSYISFRLTWDFFSRIMLDSVSRPLIVNAVLWITLAEEIMGKLYWAGAEASEGWTRLTEALNPATTDAAADLDVVYKYQLWKADTANLIAEREEPDEAKARAGQEKLRRELARGLCRPLIAFTGSKSAHLENDMVQIIDKVLELDQMISRQVAKVSWETGRLSIEHYDSQSMEPHGGGELQMEPDDYLVAITPGMMKRGTSTGANFGVNNRLLRTEVASIRMPTRTEVDNVHTSWMRYVRRQN